MSRQWEITDFQREFESSDKWTCSTYNSGVMIRGNIVKVTVELENCEANDHAAFIANVASKHINWVVDNIDRIMDHLSTSMTELANDWLQEYDDELTPEDLKKRIALEHINISGTGEFDATIPIENGNFTLLFYDDDIFGGHSIELWIHEGYEMDNDPGLKG